MLRTGGNSPRQARAFAMALDGVETALTNDFEAMCTHVDRRSDPVFGPTMRDDLRNAAC